MWLFSVYGFYSIGSASKPDGSLDKDTVMIRARRLDHLRNLQKRFPSLLAKAKIITSRDLDYHCRIIAPKSVWVTVLGQLAGEQHWANFKTAVSKSQQEDGADYLRALHDVWAVMRRFQDK
jgi:hypothetical protein